MRCGHSEIAGIVKSVYILRATWLCWFDRGKNADSRPNAEYVTPVESAKQLRWVLGPSRTPRAYSLNLSHLYRLVEPQHTIVLQHAVDALGHSWERIGERLGVHRFLGRLVNNQRETVGFDGVDECRHHVLVATLAGPDAASDYQDLPEAENSKPGP